MEEKNRGVDLMYKVIRDDDICLEVVDENGEHIKVIKDENNK